MRQRTVGKPLLFLPPVCLGICVNPQFSPQVGALNPSILEKWRTAVATLFDPGMGGVMTTATSEQNSLRGRFFAAAVVIGLGLLAAWPFYKSAPPVPPYRRGSPVDGAKLILRNQDIILQVSSRVEESPAPSLPPRNAILASDQRTISPPEESPRLPDLPAQYRSLLDPNSTQPNANLPPAPGRVLEASPLPPLREHVLVDGDTLSRLAERYLGSAARSGEILELNRDVLGDGSLLPIGKLLKIPPRVAPPAASGN